MKYLLVIVMLGVVSCGGTNDKLGTTDSDDSSVSGLSEYSYQGTLKVGDLNSGCYGGDIAYILYNGKSYEVSDSSIQDFIATTQGIYNGNIEYQSFETVMCYNKYRFSFSGIIKQEMVFKNGGEYLTDVIEVKSYKINN